MNYLTLYRKWRPQTFSEVVGQNHVTDTLSRAIDSNRLSHAYLFTGPRGTGKTTTARILAKAINCQHGPTSMPCGVCDSCKAIASGTFMDLLEIDAASHRRVEETRGLLETIPLSPAYGRKKVYIIDEVHMLTTESFNTLLKTLEEPPDHVVFVLATTDPQNVLPTIHSRCQRFDFRTVAAKILADHLRVIAEGEGIHVDNDALLQIARAHGGSVRDAVGTLEQLWMFCPGGITPTDVAAVLGTTEYSLIFEAANLLESGSSVDLARFMQTVGTRGGDLRHFVHDLCRHYRDLLLLSEAPAAEDLLEVSAEHVAELKSQAAVITPRRALSVARALQQAELQIKNAQDPGLFIEVLLLDLCKANSIATEASPRVPAPAPAQAQPPAPRSEPAPSAAIPAKPPVSPTPVAAKPEPAEPKPEPPAPQQSAPKQSAPSSTPSAPRPRVAGEVSVADLNELQVVWPQVIELLKQMNKGSTAAYLRVARLISFDNDLVKIGLPFDNQVRRMQVPENHDALQRLLKDRIIGRECRLEFVVDDDAPLPAPPSFEGQPQLSSNGESYPDEAEAEVAGEPPREMPQNADPVALPSPAPAPTAAAAAPKVKVIGDPQVMTAEQITDFIINEFDATPADKLEIEEK